MQIESVDAIIRRISGAISNPEQTAIAFDADGTLWTGDLAEDYFFAFLERGSMKREALDGARALCTQYGLSAEGGAGELGRRLFDSYIEGHLPESLVTEFIAWIHAGAPIDEASEFARDVAHHVGLKERLQAEVTAVFSWAIEQKLRVFVVSASPRHVVEQGLECIGRTDNVELIATTARVDGDRRVMADVERPIPYADGKAILLKQAIGDMNLCAAFGDNVFDIAMLQAAKVPVAVRPKKRLLDRIVEIPSLIEIAQCPNLKKKVDQRGSGP